MKKAAETQEIKAYREYRKRYERVKKILGILSTIFLLGIGVGIWLTGNVPYGWIALLCFGLGYIVSVVFLVLFTKKSAKEIDTLKEKAYGTIEPITPSAIFSEVCDEDFEGLTAKLKSSLSENKIIFDDPAEDGGRAPVAS